MVGRAPSLNVEEHSSLAVSARLPSMLPSFASCCNVHSRCPQVRDMVGKNAIVLVGTKLDLLPEGTHPKDVAGVGQYQVWGGGWVVGTMKVPSGTWRLVLEPSSTICIISV